MLPEGARRCAVPESRQRGDGLLGLIDRPWRTREPDLDELSDYMLASEAGSIMDGLGSDFASAGISRNGSRPHGQAYWGCLVQSVEQILSTVKTITI